MHSDLIERETLHECPQCGKNSLAKISDHRYQCVWCRFYRDLSQHRGFGNDIGGILLVFFLGALLLALLL